MKQWFAFLLCVTLVVAQWERLDVPQEQRMKRNTAGQQMSLNGLHNCDPSDDAFLNCVRVLFDANSDDVITREELRVGFARDGFFSANMDIDWIMNGGDYNHDGVLDMNDWNHPNRTVFYKEATTPMFACFFCRSNGVNMDKPPAK